MINANTARQSASNYHLANISGEIKKILPVIEERIDKLSKRGELKDYIVFVSAQDVCEIGHVNNDPKRYLKLTTGYDFLSELVGILRFNQFNVEYSFNDYGPTGILINWSEIN